jgi:hypothetical protein
VCTFRSPLSKHHTLGGNREMDWPPCERGPARSSLTSRYSSRPAEPTGRIVQRQGRARAILRRNGWLSSPRATSERSERAAAQPGGVASLCATSRSAGPTGPAVVSPRFPESREMGIRGPDRPEKEAVNVSVGSADARRRSATRLGVLPRRGIPSGSGALQSRGTDRVSPSRPAFRGQCDSASLPYSKRSVPSLLPSWSS